MTRSRSPLLLGLFSGIYLLWSSLFIFHSSFVAIDGQRYFSLADDAMISMRYAWNFSGGYGLVWNPNEYVEGYSNFLMTLLMSVSTRLLDKNLAVLAMQILGVTIVLICAWLTREIAKEVFREHPRVHLLQNLSFISVLFYYHLSFWSIMGMETGLLTALCLASVLHAIHWIRDPKGNSLYFSSIAGGLAFLTRNEAIVFSGLLFMYVLWFTWMEQRKRENFSRIFASLVIYALFVFGFIGFRLAYYHELMPNTYFLKVGNVPYQVRINDGIIYVLAFLKESIVPLIFAVLGLLVTKDRIRWMFLGLFSVLVLYAIWTGGDAWNGWRFIMPSLPLVLVLSIAGVAWLSERRWISKYFPSAGWLTGILVIISILSTTIPFWRFISFQRELPDVSSNRHNMDVAIAINELTTKDARIGVFYAGLIPYYTGRYTIDFLGKSDKIIARQYPHLSENITWMQRITTPGHNKYDLNYSIKKLRPDYIQRFYWAHQNIRDWAIQRYVRLEYQGAQGSVTLIVKKDSPFINWTKGKLTPWGSTN